MVLEKKSLIFTFIVLTTFLVLFLSLSSWRLASGAVVTASLSANPTTINRGQSSTLNWLSTNARSCSIDQGIGSVGPVALSGTLVQVAGHPHYVSTNGGQFTFGAWGCNTNNQIVFTQGGCSVSGACLFLSGNDNSSIKMTAINPTQIKVEARLKGTSVIWNLLGGCQVSGSVTDQGVRGSTLLRGEGNRIVPNSSGTGFLEFSKFTGSGAISVSPVNTTTYTLSCDGLYGGVARASATVSVIDVPGDPPLAGTNIGVCVNPPSPDVTNPSQPIFRWTTYGNPQVKYWLKVDDDPSLLTPVINTGAVTSGNKFYQVASNQLPQGQTYWYQVAVRDSFGWTNWVSSSFFLPISIGNFSLSLGGSVACNSVPLSWTAASGADAYRILRGSPRVDISPYQPYTALNFTDTTVSQNTTYQYQIEAYNAGGTNRSNEITVTTPYCPPTLNFSSSATNIFQGQSVTLIWSTSYVTSCTASNAWSGSKPLNGSEVVVPLPPPSVTYTLTCSGPAGSISGSVTINITPLALPNWREIIPR